jgi:hypothetical protein
MNIDERSKISFFAVICALPFIIGAILWLASIDAKASQASEETKSLKTLILDVRERVIRIESALEQKHRGK